MYSLLQSLCAECNGTYCVCIKEDVCIDSQTTLHGGTISVCNETGAAEEIRCVFDDI